MSTDLPIPDYDHLQLGDLTTRIRTLDTDGVVALLGHEREHGARVPVLAVLEARLTALREGAEPSGGAPSAAAPVASAPPGGEPDVSPATSGPVQNPPPHGKPPYTTPR